MHVAVEFDNTEVNTNSTNNLLVAVVVDGTKFDPGEVISIAR